MQAGLGLAQPNSLQAQGGGETTIAGSPHYIVVFDVLQTSYRHGSQIFYALVFLVLAVALPGGVWFARRAEQGCLRWWHSLSRTLNLLALCLMAVGIFLAYSVHQNHKNFLKLRFALKESHYEVVAGVVTQFVPPDRRRAAQFVVGGLQFRCWNRSLQNGFSENGLIHNGQQVRIAFVRLNHDNEIVRLEIAE